MNATYQTISQETIDFAKDLPLIDLVERLLYFSRRKTSNNMILCPFHEEKSGSMNINAPGNFFKCHGCGANGKGSISFMIQYLWGPNAKGNRSKFIPAIEAICETMNHHIIYEDAPSTDQNHSKPSRTESTPRTFTPNSIKPSAPSKDMKLIKKANQLLLKHTQLSPEHFDHLTKARKLKKKTIIEKGYRSFPEKPSHVAREMAKELPTLEGIPGFYQATPKKGDKYWTLRGSAGFLIPVRNEHMEITGFQYRLDKPRYKITCLDLDGNDHKLLSAQLNYETMELCIKWSGQPSFSVPIKEACEIPVSSNGKNIGLVKVKPMNKYLWLASTDLEKGTPATASYHIAVPTSFLKEKKSPIGVKRVGITEGPLKGDIAAEILNIPFSCTPGLSNWKVCVEGALALKADEYIIYLDADALMQRKIDYTTGEILNDLGTAIEGIAKALVQAGKKVFLAAWDQSEAKGIDDILLMGLTPKIFPIN
ncbi:CHC2 zinc finger domain-containing protein [Brevibacillus reuszeri]|uniref:CHC2 zinc finger domain-containing protein n=1 Tax=Brevibacillus reuszeri TaxID=54915 RepID=UPI003D1E488E